MAKSLLVLISGSSGVGKNTVIKEIIKGNKNSGLLKSTTTRAMRVDDDKKNPPYDFVTREEFEQMIEKSEILEYDIFNDNYYGISKNQIKREMENTPIILKDITVKGVLSCREALSDKVPMVSIFLTERKSVLKKRLKERQTKDIKGRLKVYSTEQKKIPLYDFVIINNNLENTLNKVNAIIDLKNTKSEILTLVSCQKVNENRIDKYISKIEKGKKLKPIQVIAYENKIYIVNGINRYLAHLKTNTHCLKQFLDCNCTPAINEDNLKEWQKIVKVYTQK